MTCFYDHINKVCVCIENIDVSYIDNILNFFT